MYEIIQKLQTNNRTNKKFKPIGIVVHETATPGATDEAESRYFDRTTRKSSVHVFIDWDSLTQKVPFDEVAWHAGRTANYKYLGIELCRPLKHDSEKFQEVWKRAVWCFAYIFINYIHETAISKLTLPAHDDVTRWWHQTDHTDPKAYFKEYGKTIDDFRNDVQQEIKKQLGKDISDRKMIVELIVTISELNCRKGPGIEYPVIKQFMKGDKVTAVDLVNGWWKLDVDGVPGYISQKYTVKNVKAGV